jgi:hypothetical protein
MVDYIGDPTQCCMAHDEWYYFHCWKCFDPRHDEAVHLRVVLPRRKKGKRRE